MSRIAFAIFGKIRIIRNKILPTHSLIQLYPVNNFSPSLDTTRWWWSTIKSSFEQTKKERSEEEKRFIDQKPRGNNSNFYKFPNNSGGF